MKHLRAITILIMIAASSLSAHAAKGEICVFINMRGNTGMEGRVRNILSREFNAFERVKVVDDRELSHLYLDFSLIEQEPVRFYGLGVCIAYHISDNFYSRPTSDVAQFGEGRMEEVCVYLAKEIDKGFLEPLRQP